MIPTPIDVAVWSFLGGITSVVGFFLLSVYDEYKSWERHVIWEDDATWREKARSHWNNLRQRFDTRKLLMKYVPLWYVVGDLFVFVLILLSVGIGVVFL